MLLHAAAEAGLEEAQARRLSELPEPLPERVPLALHHRLWDVAMRETRDPSLPIRVAEHTEIAVFDVLGFVLMTSADLRDALGHVARYSQLFSNASSWVYDDDRATLEMMPTGASHLAARCATESVLAQVARTIRAMVGRDDVLERASFRHAAPQTVEPHRAFFASDLVFDAPRAALSFRRAALAYPLVRAEPSLNSFLRRHADTLLPTAPPVTLPERVERLVRESLPHGVPSRGSVAQRLASSERTMRRRLKENGTTFEDIVASVRRQMAERYVRDGSLSLGEVGFLLGFADQSSFFRAFRRWTGVTPASYRAQAGAR